ncbi:unnamed protein product [Prunus armeniaca]
MHQNYQIHLYLQRHNENNRAPLHLTHTAERNNEKGYSPRTPRRDSHGLECRSELLGSDKGSRISPRQNSYLFGFELRCERRVP